MLQPETFSTDYYTLKIANAIRTVCRPLYLNEVVRTNFRTDARYLIRQLLAGLPLGASIFGIRQQ